MVMIIFSCVEIYSFTTQQLNKEKLSIHDNKQSLFDLEYHWNSGNIAVLIRHTERCDRSDNTCLSGEDGITVPGALQAIQLNKAYNNIIDSDTVIYNSPIKRTDQTADLIFSNQSTDNITLRENCKQDIYQDILSLKQHQKNLILVTHSTCIDNLGAHQDNRLFDFDVHDESTYGGSFFVSIDADNRTIHPIGYLSADKLDQLKFGSQQ